MPRQPPSITKIDELYQLTIYLQTHLLNTKEAIKHDNPRATSNNIKAAESTVETISTELEKIHTNHTG